MDDKSTGRDVWSALDRLKRRGCVVFIHGNAPTPAFRSAVRAHLGDPAVRRERLFITLAELTHPGRWLPEGVSPADPKTTVRDLSTPNRSAAGASCASEAMLGGAGQAALAEVEAAIDSAIASSRPHSPAALRIVIHKFQALLDGSDAATLRAVIDQLREDMQGCMGRAVVVVPAAEDSPRVQQLLTADGIDVRVALRQLCGGDHPEQKYYVRSETGKSNGAPLETGWLPLD